MKKDSTKILWRVQYRIDRDHKWRNYATYETRSSARFHGFWLRDNIIIDDETGGLSGGYGFGNTRVLRVERGGK